MDARLRELEAENASLRAEVARLSAVVERLTGALEAAQRVGKRQAAPFRKPDGPAAEPKRPGRKTGRRHGPHGHREPPATQEIDERHEAPLPERCPECGGHHIEETHTAKQYQTEIPRRPIHREFHVHLGQCRDCGKHLQGRHPLQTSDALGAAAHQLGPEAHAIFAILNKGLGLSHGKCRSLFREVFGITISRATSVRSLLRTAAQATRAHQELRIAVRQSPWVVPDETGWRVSGRSAWLHAFVTGSATCYDIGGRGSEVAEQLLGANWSGTMIHDGWSVYDRFEKAAHQQCVGHLQRRCRELLQTATRGAVNLPRRVLTLIDKAFELRRQWRGHRLDRDELADAGLQLACQLERAASGRFTYAPNRRLAKHIHGHAIQWFWFLIDPLIDATNWRAEQAIRPAVVNRKVWGGNRTGTGAGAQSVLTSLLVTLRQRGYAALDWFAAARCATVPLPLPP